MLTERISLIILRCDYVKNVAVLQEIRWAYVFVIICAGGMPLNSTLKPKQLRWWCISFLGRSKDGQTSSSQSSAKQSDADDILSAAEKYCENENQTDRRGKTVR